MKEKGQTGLAMWSGVIQEDFLAELRGTRGYKKFDEMRRNSAVVAALLNAIEQSVRSVEWQFVSDIEDDERLVLCNDSLDSMTYSLNDHISEALTMLPFGYSIFELVYQRDGTRLLWKKFAFRGQNTVQRWLMDGKGSLEGFVQQINGQLIEIPIEKMILYRTKVEKNNPEGWSILRPAYPHYYFAKNLQTIEAIGAERDLNGLPVITLPEAGGSDDDVDVAEQVVRNVRMDEQMGLVLPFGWEFELASTQSTRLWDTGAIISRHEKRMLMSALAQFLILGMDRVGTMSLSEDQTDFFNMSVNATADTIADTFTKIAIPRLLKLNGKDPDGIRLEHSPAGDVNLETMCKSLQMATPFITWTPEDEVWLRALLNLPSVELEELVRLKEEAEQKEQEREERMFNNMRQDEFSASVGREHEGEFREALADFWIGQGKRIVKGVKK